MFAAEACPQMPLTVKRKQTNASLHKPAKENNVHSFRQPTQSKTDVARTCKMTVHLRNVQKIIIFSMKQFERDVNLLRAAAGEQNRFSFIKVIH